MPSFKIALSVVDRCLTSHDKSHNKGCVLMPRQDDHLGMEIQVPAWQGDARHYIRRPQQTFLYL